MSVVKPVSGSNDLFHSVYAEESDLWLALLDGICDCVHMFVPCVVNYVPSLVLSQVVYKEVTKD